MKRLTGLALLVGISTPALAVTGFLLDRVAVNTHAAQTFAVLPDGVRFPEGIALDAGTGNLFVATFDFGPNENQLLRYDSHGRLEAQKSFGPTPLLGMAINDFDGKLYLTNFGTGEVQRVEVGFGADSSVETVAALPSIGAPMERIEGNPDGSTDTIVFGANFSAPNAIAFDSAGTLYVSDSFQGAVFMASDVDTCTSNCTLELVVQDPLLATAGFPPFGANGLALSPDESTLFVANTGDDRVLAVDLASYSVSIFAESINGADGLAMGPDGTLWVAANQADQLVGLNENGRVVAELGEFLGINRDGTPRGLLFPASVAIDGSQAFVTNFALALTPNIGDEPEEDVTRYTIARVHLPNL